VSVLSRPWNRLTVGGKILLPLLALVVLLTVLLMVGWLTGLIPALIGLGATVITDNIDILRFVAAVTAILLFTVPTAFVIIFMEMKFIAFINLRVGPNRTGPWGTLSSVFHGFKVLAKEDFTPTGADTPVFTLAPVVTYLAAVLGLLVIPFAPGLVGLDMNIGLLYFFAVSGLSVVGLMMGGWFVATAIGNKLTMIGIYWSIWYQSSFFIVLGLMALVMAVVLAILLKPLKKAMPGV